jgi:CubicO group peptidase (beta-lactamase class C family)
MDPETSPLHRRLQRLLVSRAVTGASVAYVRGDSIEIAAAGFRDQASADPVTPETVFPAASLTKPIVSYAVLQLADSGVLNLDEPLSRWTPQVVPDDPSSSLITLRHVLTHTCGLQNIRGKEPVRMYFAPGSWFSYASMGFTFMQSAIEAVTGEALETTMQRLVFGPLGMRSSSLEWQDRFLTNMASPHEAEERIETHRPAAANASYTLHTTAFDYGTFIAAVLGGARLKTSTWEKWLTADVMVPKGAIVHLRGAPAATETDIGWGLGWGVEPSQRAFFQWGKMSGVRAFALGSLDQQTGVVLLTNSNRGLRLMDDVTRDISPGNHAAIRWLAENVAE